MNRRQLLTGAAATLAAAALSRMASAAYRECDAYACVTGIAQAQFGPHARYQDALNLCWAAVLEMIFSWHGVRLDQLSIVQQVYGQVIDMPASVDTLIGAINRSYYDDSGRVVNIRSTIASADYGYTDFDNRQIVAALADDQPMIYCNITHMMALIAVEYQQVQPVPAITNALLVDPLYPDNFRTASASELQPLPMGELRFLAIPSVWA